MKLTADQIQLISKTTLEFLEKEKQKQEKMKRDRRLHNIKLLLRNYRAFKKHSQDIELHIDVINDRLSFVTIDSDEFKLESIKRSKERTLVMVKYIDKVLAVYKAFCEESDVEEDMRQYKTIYYLYISDSKMTAEEIARRHSVHPRTVYKDVNKACEALATLMFGLDGVNFN